MKEVIKVLCIKCAGVIDGDIFDLSTGEYPCKCGENTKKAFKNQFSAIIHWKNGREVQNTKKD